MTSSKRVSFTGASLCNKFKRHKFFAVAFIVIQCCVWLFMNSYYFTSSQNAIRGSLLLTYHLPNNNTTHNANNGKDGKDVQNDQQNIQLASQTSYTTGTQIDVSKIRKSAIRLLINADYYNRLLADAANKIVVVQNALQKMNKMAFDVIIITCFTNQLPYIN